MKFAVSVSGFLKSDSPKSLVCHTMILVEAKDLEEAQAFGYGAATIIYPKKSGWNNYNAIAAPVDGAVSKFSDLKEFIPQEKDWT